MALWPVPPSPSEFGLNKLNSKLAWDRTKRLAKQKYQWQVKDMIKAGINPILALNSPSSAAAPVPKPVRPMDFTASLSKRKLSQEKAMQESGILRNAAEAERAREAGVASAAAANLTDVQTEIAQFDLNRASNASDIEEQYPQAQPIERLVRVFGPLLAIGGIAMLPKGIRALFARHAKELAKVKALRSRSTNVIRGSGRVPLPQDTRGVPIHPMSSPQHRNHSFR